MNDIKLKFFPLDIEYETLDSGNVEVSLFGITPDRKKIKIIDSFYPYFWVILNKKIKVDKIIKKIKKSSSLVVEVEAHDKKYLCDNVKALKVYSKNVIDLRKIKNEIKEFKEIYKIRELDISVRKKYLIDNKVTPYSLCKIEGKIERENVGDISYIVSARKIKQVSSDSIKEPRILAFDLETSCKGPSPNPKEDPILMCSFYGSNNFKRVVTWKPTKLDYVKVVNGESEMIHEIVKTIKDFDPEILVGYGSDFFDFPYLRERAKKYKLDLALGWDGSEPTTKLRNRQGSTKILGITHLDVSSFIRKIIGYTLSVERYSLDRVAKAMIGKGKSLSLQEYDINQLWDGSDKDLQRLVKYNLRDSELTFKIAEKVLSTQLQLAKLLGLSLYDINRMQYSQLVEQYLIKNAPEYNQIVPARPKKANIKIRSADSYTGAFVFEPTAGIYENIGSFDYRSLYPSIISAHNIGPDTVNCECCKNKAKKLKIEGEEIWFCEKHSGFFAGLIRDLIDRRKRIKQILKDTKKKDAGYVELRSLSYALKTLANSSYGYLGYSGARWYCLDCVKSITKYGRNYINNVFKIAEKFGFKVIYGDTDSAFLLLKDGKNVKKFLKKVNSDLPEPMELEYQDKYKRGLFLQKKSGEGGAKKRYALLKEDGEIVLKGIEAIRGDWSQIAKKAQKKVIKLMLENNSAKEAEKYIKELIKDVKKRNVNIYDLALQSTLTRSLEDYSAKGPHVVAAEKAKEKGYNVGKGYTVSYIVGEGSGKIGDRVILAEDASKKDYDTTYYIENQILRAVYKLFELFDYDLSKLASGQSKLTNW